jgi:hypothetical protein
MMSTGSSAGPGFGAEDELRGDAPDAFQARQPPEHGVVEGQFGRFRGKQRRGDVGERALRNDEYIGAQPGEAHGHAPFDVERHRRRAAETR